MPSSSFSEFQLSTEALLPLKEILSLATNPLENFEVFLSWILTHFSMGGPVVPASVTVERATASGPVPA